MIPGTFRSLGVFGCLDLYSVQKSSVSPAKCVVKVVCCSFCGLLSGDSL